MNNKERIKKNNEYVLAIFKAGHSLSCIDPIDTFFPPRPMVKPIMRKKEENVIKFKSPNILPLQQDHSLEETDQDPHQQ